MSARSQAALCDFAASATRRKGRDWPGLTFQGRPEYTARPNDLLQYCLGARVLRTILVIALICAPQASPPEGPDRKLRSASRCLPGRVCRRGAALALGFVDGPTEDVGMFNSRLLEGPGRIWKARIPFFQKNQEKSACGLAHRALPPPGIPNGWRLNMPTTGGIPDRACAE